MIILDLHRNFNLAWAFALGIEWASNADYLFCDMDDHQARHDKINITKNKEGKKVVLVYWMQIGRAHV